MDWKAESGNGNDSARAWINFLDGNFLAADCSRSSAMSTPKTSSDAGTLVIVMFLPKPQPRSSTRIWRISLHHHLLIFDQKSDLRAAFLVRAAHLPCMLESSIPRSGACHSQDSPFAYQADSRRLAEATTGGASRDAGRSNRHRRRADRSGLRH